MHEDEFDDVAEKFLEELMLRDDDEHPKLIARLLRNTARGAIRRMTTKPPVDDGTQKLKAIETEMSRFSFDPAYTPTMFVQKLRVILELDPPSKAEPAPPAPESDVSGSNGIE